MLIIENFSDDESKDVPKRQLISHESLFTRDRNKMIDGQREILVKNYKAHLVLMKDSLDARSLCKALFDMWIEFEVFNNALLIHDSSLIFGIKSKKPELVVVGESRSFLKLISESMVRKLISRSQSVDLAYYVEY